MLEVSYHSRRPNRPRLWGAAALLLLLPLDQPEAGASDPPTGSARDNWEIACTIRHDKFDYVLPAAMRANNVDMWIVIGRGRGTEPLTLDFAASTVNGQGFFVFSARGGERVERIQLGGETELAEPFRSRFVSAQKLIASFHGDRVATELVEFAKAAALTRHYLERALSNEVITSGLTTHDQVAWWLEEKRQLHGLQRAWYPTVYVHLPDGSEIAGTDRVIQPGDILQIDWGVVRDNYGTDMKRFAYVLGEGETEVPAGVQEAFAETHKVREIIRQNVRPGRTGREQIDNLKELIRQAGYVYTEDERASDADGIEVNVGMHAAGNIGHDLAAALFEIYPVRTEYMVRPNNILSLEYIVFTPTDEWNGGKIPVNVEENVVITHRGIEWLVPPQRQVLVIH